MKKPKIIILGLISILFLYGNAAATLSDLGNGVIYDDTYQQYWIKDLTLFTDQTKVQQMNTIAGLNVNPAYQNSAWGTWHLADPGEALGLFMSWLSIDDFFIRSDTGSDSWPSYYTYWWGRYDSTIVINDITWDKVMHVGYRVWPNNQCGSDTCLPQNWGGMENYVLPDATIAHGIGLHPCS